MTTLEAALLYESWGWCVVPLYPIEEGRCTCKQAAACKQPGKHPWVKWKGLKHTPREEVMKLWSKRPGSGVGVLTGHRSGIGVLDLDGDTGKGALRALVEEHGPLTTTLASVSGSGVGEHYIYTYPEDETYANSASVIGKGIDIRGEGGLFVAPPSAHKSGKLYEWRGEPVKPTATMPGWLLGFARRANGGQDLPFEERFPKDKDGKIAKGAQYSYLFRLGAKLQSSGFKRFEVEAVLGAVYDTRLSNVDPRGKVEAIETALSNWDKYAQLKFDANKPRPAAESFIDVRRPTILRVNDDWFAYNCVGYEELEEETVRSEVYEFLASGVQSVKVSEQWTTEPFEPNAARVFNTVDALKALAHRPRGTYSPPCWLEGDGPDPMEIVACENGLLDLGSGELLEPTPNFFTRNVLGIAYDPDAAEPERWLQFLEEIFPSEPSKSALLQEWFGYCLVPDTSQQKILPLIGPTRSGKGTIARVLRMLVGEANVVGPSLHKLAGTFALQSLIGKTLMVVSDLRIGKNTDLAAVTETLLTVSGEDLITTDRKNKMAWSGQLPTRIMIISNELPRIADTSAAIANRFMPLETEVSFLDKEDSGLTKTLLEELPGVLCWAVAGLKRMRERGRFDPPASTIEAIETIGNLGSPIREFLEECCELGDQYEAPATELFEAYLEWANRTNVYKVSAAIFGRDLRAAAQIKRIRRREGEGRGYAYQGVRLVWKVHSPF